MDVAEAEATEDFHKSGGTLGHSPLRQSSRWCSFFRSSARELLLASLLGLTRAAAVSGIGIARGGPALAVIVASTMVIVAIVGSVIGLSLPFILNRLWLDPAAASAPLVTSIADATGVVIYFSIATSP
jgi:magnesium transporter